MTVTGHAAMHGGRQEVATHQDKETKPDTLKSLLDKYFERCYSGDWNILVEWKK